MSIVRVRRGWRLLWLVCWGEGVERGRGAHADWKSDGRDAVFHVRREPVDDNPSIPVVIGRRPLLRVGQHAVPKKNLVKKRGVFKNIKRPLLHDIVRSRSVHFGCDFENEHL